MNLYNLVYDELKEDNIEMEQFSELVSYLLENGVICKERADTDSESRDFAHKKEKELYETFLECEGILRDYLSIVGIELKHNRDFHSIRIYPPGADYPGKENEDFEVLSTGMRKRLNNEESAYLLTFYLLYDTGVNEGKIEASGEVVVKHEEFATALVTYLGLQIGKKSSVMESMKTLKRLKAIRYREAADEEDLIYIIRPLIRDIVLPETVKPILQTLQQEETNETA